MPLVNFYPVSSSVRCNPRRISSIFSLASLMIWSRPKGDSQPKGARKGGGAKRQQLVENPRRIRQVLVYGAPVGSAHVAGHRLDFRAALTQPLPKANERLLASTFAHLQHAATFQIDH